MLRITVEQQQELRRATVDDVARRLALEIMKTARRRPGRPALDEESALACSQKAIELCQGAGIGAFGNLRKIAVLMAFGPERLYTNDVAMAVLERRTLEESWRVELLHEMGLFDDLPGGAP
jgi:hypothetical protein